MCGRYSVGARPEEIAEKLGAELAPSAAGAPARFNVAPSQPAPLLALTPARRLGLARFGWSLPNKKGLLLNARVEGIATNGLFRAAAARHRALVPADGFYEWLREGKTKRAFFLRDAEGSGLLTFAAVFDVGRPAHTAAGGPTADDEPKANDAALGGLAANDEPSATETAPSANGIASARRTAPARASAFLVVTRPAEGVVLAIHDRMPLIVPAALRDLWLSRAPLDDALSALRATHPALQAWEVSSRVGSPAIDEPWLRDAIGPAPTRPPGEDGASR